MSQDFDDIIYFEMHPIPQTHPFQARYDDWTDGRQTLQPSKNDKYQISGFLTSDTRIKIIRASLSTRCTIENQKLTKI